MPQTRLKHSLIAALLRSVQKTFQSSYQPNRLTSIFQSSLRFSSLSTYFCCRRSRKGLGVRIKTLLIHELFFCFSACSCFQLILFPIPAHNHQNNWLLMPGIKISEIMMNYYKYIVLGHFFTASSHYLVQPTILSEIFATV